MGLLKSVWGSMFAVILPVVGWPFGVFMMKQFSENIPSSLLEAARIDGAGELTTFINVAFPIIKPGFGALAIFTFINSWNEYPLQLVMLTQNESKTIALGIASKLSEMSNDFGLIMAGAAGLCADYHRVPVLPEVFHTGNYHGRGKRLRNSRFFQGGDCKIGLVIEQQIPLFPF